MATLIPNSPRWLVMVGRESEAPAVIRDIDPTVDPDLEIEAIRESLGARQGTLRDLLGPFLGLRKIVWIGIAASVLQQFVGINVIFYYSSTLWQSVGFGESQSLLISVISSTTNIVATIVAISLIDRVGRKPLLMAGSIGMSTGLLTLAIIFANAGVDANGNPALEGLEGPIALVAANVFVFFFGLSWGPVVWVLLGEMFPNSIRAVALSVAAAAQWIANFIVSTTFPALAAIGLGVAYGLYASFAIISIFFVARVLQETKGRTLESMVG
jgi:SP family sugar:H+ symporter-like MFS transporter